MKGISTKLQNIVTLRENFTSLSEIAKGENIKSNPEITLLKNYFQICVEKNIIHFYGILLHNRNAILHILFYRMH